MLEAEGIGLGSMHAFVCCWCFWYSFQACTKCRLQVCHTGQCCRIWGLTGENMYLRPSCTSWCALQISSRPFIWLNSAATLAPNSQPAPRGLIAHVSVSSGSLHMRSQKGPSCGISHTRSIVRIYKKQWFGNFQLALDCWWHIHEYVSTLNSLKHAGGFSCLVNACVVLHAAKQTLAAHDKLILQTRCCVDKVSNCLGTWSSVLKSGDSPPCTQSTRPSINACKVAKCFPCWQSGLSVELNSWCEPLLLFLPRASENQILLCNTAMRLGCHTFFGIHHRIHTPANSQTSMSWRTSFSTGVAAISPGKQVQSYLCDLPAFMIASKQCHVSWIPGFQQHEQGEGLKAVVTPINKVTHEDIVCLRNFLASCK